MPKADEKKPKLRIKKPLYISIFIVALFALMILSERLSFFDIFEHKLLDFRFKYFNQELPVSKDIVYIDVDEESIQTLSPFYGGWPWRRGDLIADHIISYIMDCQPSGFFFDMLYVDLTSKDINDDINPQDLELSDITALYQAEDGYVSHAILFEDDPAYREMEKEDIKDNMFGPDVFEITVDDPAGYLKESEYNTVTIPFAELYDYTMHFHSVTHLEDSDGVSRNYRLIIKYKDKCYPSLALAAVIRKMGITKISINNGIMTLLNEETGYKTDLPINRNGIMPLTYYKNIHDFNNIKAVSIVISKQKSDNGEELGEQDVKPEELADKLVIFGGSAIGLKDIKITPMDKNIAGPFIHITAMSNILQNHHLITLNKWLNMLIMLVSIITIIITSTVIKNAIVKNTIGFGYIVAFLAVSMLSFKYAGININISQTLVAAILSYLGALVIVSLTEARDKKFLQSTFGTYLSPEIIDEMFKNKTNPQLGGESRYITAYFTDIQGFSTFSEKLTAAQLVELLNEYLTEMTDTLLAEKGTLDKYEGDAIIAFIGAPMNLPDNPLRACRVAVGMQNKLLALRKKWAAEVQSPDEPNRNSKNLGPDEWEPGVPTSTIFALGLHIPR
ncbi:MAG: adenylate/guanylate cyclase domain-containing protein, partial [Spirochaetales bacterium]|nr:adenylate/guanylate cyclase domain-containing protein [Spirochaetales bacterium]